jgi:surface protein
MEFMFSFSSSFNQPLNNWDTSHVNVMDHMFSHALSFNQPLGNWNVSNVTSMQGMFSFTVDFNQPIGAWDVSNVTNMDGMFALAASFNQPLGQWNVSSVTNMSQMFGRSQNFNQPLSEWDVSNVTNMKQMFYHAESFNQPLSNWNLNGDCITEDFVIGTGIIDFPMKKNSNKKHSFDGWDRDFISEQIEDFDCIEDYDENDKTLIMGLVFANVQFSEHPRIQEIGNLVENNFSDFIEQYEKCIKGEFDLPTELKEYIEVVNCGVDINDAFQFTSDSVTIDVECHVTFKIKGSFEEAVSAIDDYQKNNHDLRWNVSIYWSEND